MDVSRTGTGTGKYCTDTQAAGRSVHNGAADAASVGDQAHIQDRMSLPPVVHGLADSLDLEGCPPLPHDIDPHVLKACSVPVLMAISQVSRACHTAVGDFLETRGEPDGVQNAVRRKRFDIDRRAEEARDISGAACRTRMLQLAKIKTVDGTRMVLPATIDALAAAFAAGDLPHLWFASEFANLQQAELMQAVTAGGQWQSLSLDIENLERDRFIDKGAAILQAILPGVQGCTLQLFLGQHFTENDAHALLGYLRATPRCTSIQFLAQKESLPALAIICAGLHATSINDFRIVHGNLDQHPSIVPDLLANPKLKQLAINYVPFNDTGAEQLAMALEHNTGLTSLMLSENDLQEPGAIGLARALASHPKLKSLNFANTDIGLAGWSAMGDAIATSSSLSSIHLSDSEPGLKASKEFKEKYATGFLSALSRCSRLHELMLIPFTPSSADLTALATLVENNPTLSRLGNFRIKTQQQADAFVNAIKAAAGPLTVCSGEMSYDAAFRRAAGNTPLLKFER